MIALMLAVATQTTPVPPPIVPAATLAPFVKASAVLDDGSGSTIDLLIDGPLAVLRARGGRYDGGRATIDSVNLALMLLADKRFTALWPALLDWAGPGLEKLRDRRLADAQVEAAGGRTLIANNITSSTVRPPARAVMLLGEAEVAAGRLDDAVNRIAAARGAITRRGDWEQAEYMALSLRLGTYRRLQAGLTAQLAVLDEAEAWLGPTSSYTVNFQINRAALLADVGRAGEALAALDRADAAFAGKLKGGGGRVPGSGREFAWICICALTRLGRAAEAAPLSAAIYPAIEPRDYAWVIKSSDSIRYRLFRCTDDTAAAAHELATELTKAPIGGTAFLHLQPAYRSRTVDYAAFFRRLAAEPELQRALSGRFRVLPPELEPALNGWLPTAR